MIMSDQFDSSDNMQQLTPMFILRLFKLFTPPPTPMFSFDFKTPVNTILSFCSLSATCRREQTIDTFEHGGKCCLPCDCSDRCFSAGTCCADMTFSSKHDQSSTRVKETCVNSFITGRSYTSYPNYLLFQDCLENVDNQLKQKCLNPNTLNLKEALPVFSEITKRHYRNVLCAKCNNDVNNLVLWNTRLTCENSDILTTGFPKISSISSFLEFISSYHSCALVSDPPPNTGNVVRCISEEVFVPNCNDPFLDTLCKQHYAPVKAGFITYKNVFCLECANPSNLTGLYKACSPFQDGGVLPFTSILALNIDQMTTFKTDPSENNMCPISKTFIHKLDVCINQTCAVPEIKISSVCQLVFSKIKNIHMEYRLKLLFRAFTLDILNSLHSIPLHDDIMDVIGVTLLNICFVDIVDVKVTASYAEIRLVFIKAAEDIDIKQSYKNFEDNIEAFNNIAKKRENRKFLLKIDKTGIEPILEDTVTLLKFDRSEFAHNCSNNIAMTKLQLCGTITFHREEFILHGNGNLSIGNLMFVPGEFVIRNTQDGSMKYVQVCLDDYILAHSLMKQKYGMTSTADNDFIFKSKLWFLLCVVCFLLFHVVILYYHVGLSDGSVE